MSSETDYHKGVQITLYIPKEMHNDLKRLIPPREVSATVRRLLKRHLRRLERKAAK